MTIIQRYQDGCNLTQLSQTHNISIDKIRLILKKAGVYVQSKTEFEIMEDIGYTKIWDCGMLKYAITNKIQ